MPDNKNFHGRPQSGYNAPRNPPPVQPVKPVEIDGFYTDDGNPKKELFDKKAKDIADSIVGVSATQLRRIYDEVKRFEQIISQENWSSQYPYILMIKSKTRYAVAKATKDYHVFLALFEAVYGFCYEKLR